MKSANASVTGPAAILGSRLNRCRSEGTARPSAHAVTSESAMLPPITVAPRRCTTDLFEAKTERRKKLRTNGHSLATAGLIVSIACFQNFLGEQGRVDDSNHAALLVHHRESEEFIKHEELARVEHRRLRR